MCAPKEAPAPPCPFKLEPCPGTNGCALLSKKAGSCAFMVMAEAARLDIEKAKKEAENG